MHTLDLIFFSVCVGKIKPQRFNKKYVNFFVFKCYVIILLYRTPVIYHISIWFYFLDHHFQNNFIFPHSLMLLLTTSDSATVSEEIPHTVGTQLVTFPGCKHVFLSRSQVLLACSIGLMDIAAVIKYFSSHFFRSTMNFQGIFLQTFYAFPLASFLSY